MLLDFDTSDGAALRLASDLRMKPRHMKLVFLGGHVTDICLEQAMRVRTDGFVLKTDPLDHIVEAIEAVADGKKTFSASIRDRLIYTTGKNDISYESIHRWQHSRIVNSTFCVSWLAVTA
jgi:DNA-binding NarL/FixJ family response regulator